MPDAATTDWLLDSDPALRWQVERDLLGAPEQVWGATRAKVPAEGFGARLLAHQDPDGQWAGGAYFPADWDWGGPEAQAGSQPWTATSWSLDALREWGVDAAELGDTAQRLAANSRWDSDDRPYWAGEVDCCVNASVLSCGLWLGADVDGLVDWFLEHRMPDGGWNCEWVNGSVVSSFHSTLGALRALLDYERATGDRDRVRGARHSGAEYLLARGLLHRASTGGLVGPWAVHLTYPHRWQYSVLDAAHHLRAAALHDGTPPDPRMSEAVEMLRTRCGADGRWLQDGPHPGRVWFDVDVPAGEPSRWLTLRATAVLDWWDGERGRG
jgi:hypothetical protein